MNIDPLPLPVGDGGSEMYCSSSLAIVMACVMALLIVFCGAMPGVARAQQPNLLAGKVSNPKICPSNPSLIAYERLESGVQYIYIFHKTLGTSVRVGAVDRSMESGDNPFNTLFDSAPQTDIRVFEGQFVWRPSLDSRGRQWFAYIASGETGLDLYLSYIDENGGVSRDPIAIPLPDQQFHPVWSPVSGKSLLFVSGGSGKSDLFLVSDIDKFLQSPSAASFVPRRVTDSASLKFSPAWSPDEKTVAFEMEQEQNGRTNRGIYIVYIEDALRDPASPPIALTASLDVYDESQPSWSVNGELLAYYVTQARIDEASENQLQDIGLVNVVRGGDSGMRIVNGQVLSGLSPRLVRNVIPGSLGGPVWVEGGAAGRIVYVKRDASADFPIYIADLAGWQQFNFDYDQALENPFETKNHLDVHTTPIPGGIRLVYVGQVGSVNEIITQDKLWRGANPKPTIWQDGNNRGSMFRSLVVPGWGQLHNGDRRKGWILLGAAAATAGSAVFLATSSNTKIADAKVAEKNYLNDVESLLNDESEWGPAGMPIEGLENQFDAWEDAYDQARPLRYLIIGAASAAGVIWLYSLIDSRRGEGRPRLKPVRLADQTLLIQSVEPRLEYANRGNRPSPGFRITVIF